MLLSLKFELYLKSVFPRQHKVQVFFLARSPQRLDSSTQMED